MSSPHQEAVPLFLTGTPSPSQPAYQQSALFHTGIPTHDHALLSWYGSSQSVEWYSRPEVIDRVIQVFGTIDLDPCSNPPPYNVPATTHYTQMDNGLLHPWIGSVYMNSPYGRSLAPFMAKLAHEIALGHTTQAITLTPARTDTRWFQTIWTAQAICFWRGRLQFVGSTTGAPFPSAIAYFGPHVDRFANAFEDVGKILYP